MTSIPTGPELAAELFRNAVQDTPDLNDSLHKAALDLLGAYQDGWWLRRFLEPYSLFPNVVTYKDEETRSCPQLAWPAIVEDVLHRDEPCRDGAHGIHRAQLCCMDHRTQPYVVLEVACSINVYFPTRLIDIVTTVDSETMELICTALTAAAVRGHGLPLPEPTRPGPGLELTAAGSTR